MFVINILMPVLKVFAHGRFDASGVLTHANHWDVPLEAI